MDELQIDGDRITVFALLPDPVLLLDDTGRLVLFNPAAGRIFGLLEGSLHMPFAEVFQNWPDLVRAVSSQGSTVKLPVQIRLGDETILDVQVISYAHGTLVSMHDVSHFHQQSTMGGDFIHTISHDLRSPLTAILGYVELIDRVGELNEIQRDFMQRVIGSVQHINTLVNDLLLLATCESINLAQKDRVQVHSLVHEVTGAQYKQMLERDLNLEIDMPPKGVEYYGVNAQIRVLIEKLLENAISYTPSGGTVTIRCRAEENNVFLQIRDTGIGIPEDEQDLVFMRFYRGRNVSTRILGTGLGLPIVRAIVSNHGGEIRLESGPGEGSTFTVVLPQS